MEPFSLDAEAVLKLIEMLFRAAAYFFAGIALIGLSAYVVFLCLHIFALQPRPKTRIVKVPQPLGFASAMEQTHDLAPAETRTLDEGATVTRVDVLCELALSEFDIPNIGINDRKLATAARDDDVSRHQGRLGRQNEAGHLLLSQEEDENAKNSGIDVYDASGNNSGNPCSCGASSGQHRDLQVRSHRSANR